MLEIIWRRPTFLRGFIGQPLKRTFLSNAYKCSDVWENRLSNPAFKKINLDEIYFHLDNNFKQKKRVNVLDVDLYATSLDNYDSKDQLENILKQLRECPECILLPERTSHAVLRWYMDKAPKADIFNILSNRLLFGIFPDFYLTNLLMDKFLKENDIVSAVKVAVLQMLQEELDNPLTSSLALYCCYKYLESAEIWKVPKLSDENDNDDDDDDEEVQKVRVSYLRNPYFDDHFDIVNTNHLIGKTLWLFGNTVGGELGMSSQLIGWILYEKYDECTSFLESSIKNNVKLYSECVSKAKEYLVNVPKQNIENKEAEDSSESEKKASGTADEVTSSNNASDPVKNKILALLDMITKDNLIEGKLLVVAEKKVKESVQQNEEKEIEYQCQLYKQWEQERQAHIDDELKRNESERIKCEIEKIKKELQEEEQRLFFFENEEDIDFELKTKIKESDVVYYKGKRKLKEVTSEVYIPPDVQEKRK